MFEKQAALSPESVAVVEDDGRSMTYKDLNDACDVLADYLVLCGVKRDSPVGIYMERCLEYVISYIAILKAGGSFSFNHCDFSNNAFFIVCSEENRSHELS